jgi:predicted RNA-binding Zn ribbon-like protein
MERKAAPGDLAFVERFINTADAESGADEIDSPEKLGAWLHEAQLLAPGQSVGADDVRRATVVREALRGLALANNGGPLYPLDLATLNQAASETDLRLRFVAPKGARLETAAAGVDALLGRVLGAVFTSMVDRSWTRMKACRRHTCRHVFYDATKNRSGTWCSMALCGNRTKAETYRRRRSASVTPV